MEEKHQLQSHPVNIITDLVNAELNLKMAKKKCGQHKLCIDLITTAVESAQEVRQIIEQLNK
jgi:hypothetical protein